MRGIREGWSPRLEAAGTHACTFAAQHQLTSNTPCFPSQPPLSVSSCSSRTRTR